MDDIIDVLELVVKIVIIFTVVFIIIAGAIWIGVKVYYFIFPPLKNGGESCSSNEECLNKECIKVSNNESGHCKLSSEGGKCESDRNCESELACRSGECLKLSQFCTFRQFSSLFFLFGVAMFVCGLIFGVTIGKLEYKGISLSGAAIGVFFIVFSVWIQFLITC